MCKTKFQYILWILLIGVSMIACQQAGEPNAKNESEFKALSADTEFDLVIKNGRVMDPETGFDKVANVGVKDGTVGLITEKDISGKRVIDASGHVVAPGFIDYHSHAQEPYGHKLYVRDGVTTPLDLEVGAFPVNDFYEFWEGKSFVNYGTNVAHVGARLEVLDGQEPDGRVLYSPAMGRAMNDGSQFKTKLYDPKDEKTIVDAVEREIKQGALGIAYPIGYYTVVGSPEINAVTALAGKYNLPITTHVRYLAQIPPSGYMGITEMLTIARQNDAPVLFHHVQSNCLGLTGPCLDLIDAARAQGQKVVGEFYPYQYAGTYVDADYNRPGFEQRMGIEASDYVITATGEHLTSKKFDSLRTAAPGTNLLMYTMKEEYIMEAFKRPGTIVGSDGMPWIVEGDEGGFNATFDTPYGAGNGHARGSGTHARILRMVRETKAIPLMEAIGKMTYGPASFLEDHVPQMKRRGRIQEGSAADITIFDPETVTDNATPKIGENSLPSTGIPYVIVNGTVVVDDSKVQNVAAGVAIRNKTIN
ncbi:amidohydrolase family protein [Robiginitalea aurantiaca]|uniref:Amidohydrolase family protein n=1 Tax=Robiginitalea aurantiaca TaxID=3056915 RepID=A0ABT7WC38_9FLAO|nr:amidohydrolase family protein [Robiginitalea aurantiaca]MDM9630482.1 amidohydrolase family protein [Robiginitalea aurantiaca]